MAGGIAIPLTWRTGVFAICVLISMTFVFVPRVFYGSSTDDDEAAMMLVPVYKQFVCTTVSSLIAHGITSHNMRVGHCRCHVYPCAIYSKIMSIALHH
jgi:hypothetical protein